MSVTDPYFQFPLCALAFGKTEDERLNAILDYSVVEAGKKLWPKAHPADRAAFLDRLHQHIDIPEKFNRQDNLHCAALFGASRLRVTYSDLASVIERHERLRKFIVNFQTHYGRDPFVRMKASWLFAARDSKGLSYGEFAVLCAIYSAIGKKRFARITQPRIGRCALGYRTAAIFSWALPHRVDGAQPFTDGQIRRTIERLHRNHFFARSTVGRRRTYYSIRLDHVALRKALEDRATYPHYFRKQHASEDAALTARIKARRADAANAPNPKHLD